jgi:transcriptional regulator with XRE-family HTH domain
LYDRQTFGQAVTERRRARNLAQKAVADAAGISTAYLSDIENGRRSPSNVVLITGLAHALGADPDALAIRAGQLPAQIKDLTHLSDDQLTEGVKAFVAAASSKSKKAPSRPKTPRRRATDRT